MPTQGPSIANELDTVAYHIQPGDTVIRIIHKYYGVLPHAKQQALIEQIQAENSLRNADMIFPGQLLKLSVPRLYCAAPQEWTFASIILSNDDSWFYQLNHDWQTASADERRMASNLAPLILGAGAAGMTMIDKTFATNAPTLAEMAENYESYKARKITKGQYDYRRRSLLNQLESKLGPTKALLTGSKNPSEVLRISRSKGTAPTQPITQQLKRMNSLSKVASKGGIALSVVGLGVACHQIAQTDNQQKKNEILVESLGGLMGGLAYGVAATLTVGLMVTPVGWVGALLIGAGGAVVGHGTGKVFKKLYSLDGRQIDIASAAGVTQTCNSSNVRRGATKGSLLSSNVMSML